MVDFDFYNPTHIVFGKDRLDAINNLVPMDARVLITFGNGSAEKNGLIDETRNILEGRMVFEFGGIGSNPRYETLVKGIELVRNEKIDFIMAVGGGSVIDGTKFIALASHYTGEYSDLLNYGLVPVPLEVVGEAVLFGVVLTLAGTGSEMNNRAVISYKRGKYLVKSRLIFPEFSILDPTLTFTVPNIQVANGVIATFVHIIEHYLTYPVEAKVQDRMAEGLLLTLIEIGETTVNEPDNYAARANQVWSATLALNGMIGSGVPKDWTTQIIGHELTAWFGIDYAQALAIILPSVLQVRREQKRVKLIQYAKRVWGIEDGSDNEKIELAIRRTREFFESLGVKTYLSEYGISVKKIQKIVNQLEKHGMVALSETKDLTLDISQKILENAM